MGTKFRLSRLAFLFLAWGGAMASAQPPKPSDKPPVETTAEKLRKALDQVRDVEIIDQPLEQAINQLRELTKINFVLDRAVLMMAQVDPTQQQPVGVKAKGVKLRSALRSLLSTHNLTYVIVTDQVLITTEDMAMYRQLRQRVSVDCDNVPFSKALRQLARETGTNLVVDSKVNKEADAGVSLQLDDVPLDTALRLMSEAAGLKPVRMGNVLYVTSKANANELRSEPDLAPPMQGRPGMEQMMWQQWGAMGIMPGMGMPGAVLPPPPVTEKAEGEDKKAEKPPEKDKPAEKSDKPDKDKP